MEDIIDIAEISEEKLARVRKRYREEHDVFLPF